MKEVDNQVDIMSLMLDIFLSSRLHVSVSQCRVRYYCVDVALEQRRSLALRLELICALSLIYWTRQYSERGHNNCVIIGKSCNGLFYPVDIKSAV